MIVTKIALTALIAFVSTAFATVVIQEEIKLIKWFTFSTLDKVLVLCLAGSFVSLIVALLAFVWGL